MAEYYSAELSQKVRRGMNESRHKGNTTGGRTPFGYRLVDKKYIIYEPEAEIVRLIFTECAAGKQVNIIAEELKDRCVFNNGKPFARNTIYHMLSNERYSGVYSFGGEVFTNTYPRIVPENIYEIVKNKIAENKYGKHNPEVVYLLKNKLICGYCGQPVNSDSGTSKSGKIKRYYKCSGKRKTKNCPLNPIRKEVIEELVLNAIYNAFATPELISNLADKIMELHKKRINDNSVLEILLSEYSKTQRAIDNLLTAMENGIITASTKERLDSLEIQKVEIGEKISIEKAKTKLLLTQNDIVSYIQKGVKKQGRQMIKLLVKEIRLFNDKVQIYLNYTDKPSPQNKPENKESPDGEDDRRGFCFYSCERTISINTHGTGNIFVDFTYKVSLFI